MQIIDISDPENPGVPYDAGEVDGAAWDVYISGDYAFLAYGGKGLRFVDVLDPEKPEYLSYYLDTLDVTHGVWLSGDHTYLADGRMGLLIVDASNVRELRTVLQDFDTPGSAESVYASDGYIYVADTFGISIFPTLEGKSSVERVIDGDTIVLTGGERVRYIGSGGQVVEQIVHLFDLTRYLLGEAESAFCWMNNIFHTETEGYTAEDVSATSLKFKSGAVATVSGTNGAIPGQWLSQYELITQNLTARFSDANNAELHQTDLDWSKTIIVKSEKDIYLAETLDLIEAIEEDKDTRIPMYEGAKTLELVLAVRKAADTGRPVKIG